MLSIAILIKLDSPGAVFYMPRMVGKNGQEFLLFRFRTMLSMNPNLSPEQRLTRIGHFIRNYSLDHLPMLVNLLKGDLTLVGPRPMEVEIVNLQEPTWQRYFQTKPGLVNYAVLKLGKFWTPSRESHPALNQELELEYLQQRSTAFDVKLFFQSFWALVASGGNVKARGEPEAELESRLRNH